MYNRTVSYNIHLGNAFISVCLILYSILLVVGIVGNILTCAVVVLNKSMRRSIHFYTFNLSLADGLLLVIYVPTQMKMTYDNLHWHMGKAMCSFCNFTISLCLSASVGTLMAISADRLRAVKHPFAWKANSQRLSKIIIPVIWFVSAVVAFPVAYVADLRHEGNSTDLLNCIEVWPDSGLGYWITIMIMQYIVPLISMGFINGVILYEIKQSGKSINTLHKRMLRMMILLLLTYAICTGMQHMAYFATVITGALYPHLFVISNLVVSLQAAINPLIYGTNRNDFEQAIIGIFKYCASRISNFVTKKQNHSTFKEYQEYVSETSFSLLTPSTMRKNINLETEEQNRNYLQVPGRESESEELKRIVRAAKRRETMAFINDFDQMVPLKNEKVKRKSIQFKKKSRERKSSGKKPLAPLIIITEPVLSAEVNMNYIQTLHTLNRNIVTTNNDPIIRHESSNSNTEKSSAEIQIKKTCDELERIQEEIENTLKSLEQDSNETVSENCEEKVDFYHNSLRDNLVKRSYDFNSTDSGYWTSSKTCDSGITLAVSPEKNVSRSTTEQFRSNVQNFKLNSKLFKDFLEDSKESYI